MFNISPFLEDFKISAYAGGCHRNDTNKLNLQFANNRRLASIEVAIPACSYYTFEADSSKRVWKDYNTKLTQKQVQLVNKVVKRGYGGFFINLEFQAHVELKLTPADVENICDDEREEVRNVATVYT